MPKFCLLPQFVDKFKKGLVSGEIDPRKLSEMTSTERRSFLENYVGKENAVETNALFESKLLLKNQKAGYIAWAKRIGGMSKQARRDIISRIEKMDNILSPEEEKAFLEDLASQKLGVGISVDEAKTISDLSSRMVEARGKITDNLKIRSKERMEYGLQNALLKEYVSKLKADARKIRFTQQPVKYTTNLALNAVPDLARTLQTAYDNSIWGRQLISVLFNPKYSLTWTKNFLKSWKDIGVSLAGGDPMLGIKADVFSRPNALNGKYAADPVGYGLGVLSEEVYSSTLPAKIPVLGRLFKASEAAFNGGALRVRADIADMVIKAAEKNGKNVLDKRTAQALGSLVTSMTGRGSAGASEGLLRKVFYAPRFYAGEVNQLTAHLFDPKANAYVRKEAAKNLLLNLGTTSLLLSLASALDPNSVDHDKHLGKIKIWGNWVDITGGKASFVNLAVKMSQKVNEYMQGKSPKYGEQTALDLLENFAEGKLGPVGSVLKDVLTGTMYGGERVTLEGELKSKFVPIPIQTATKILKDQSSTNALGSIILDMLGFGASTNTTYPKNWSTNPTQAQAAFLSEVGKDKFKEANDLYNKEYNNWYQKISTSQSYKKLSKDAQSDLNKKAKDKIQEKVFEKYNFKYTKQAETPNQIEEKENLKKLLP